MKHYCFDDETVILTTYGKYNKETDTHEELYFRVPQDWLMEYMQKEEMDYESVSDFCNNYTWDTSLPIHERAMTEGMLLPVNETDGCCYHLKAENEELAQQLYNLGDDDFYDVMMCLAQKMNVSYIDIDKFTRKLNQCLDECQDSLFNSACNGKQDFIDKAIIF